MKKIALILTGAFFSVSTMGLMANTIENNMAIESKYDGKKQKVDQEELPQEVIQSLEESEYQNWEIQEAYKVEDEMTSEVHYELHLASDVEAEKVRFVKFNEQGEIISDEDSELGRMEDQEFEQPQAEPGLEDVEPRINETQPGLEGSDEEIEGTEHYEGAEPEIQPDVEGQQY